MARIRSIKPETFTSETLAAMSVHARWTFGGLWCYCDDEGRGRANVGLIKAAVWPLDDDVTPKHIEDFLNELETGRLICRYEVDGRSYLHVVNFTEHQHPNRPLASKLPACSRRTHGGLSELSVSPHNGTPADTAAVPPENVEAKDHAETGKTGRTAKKPAGQGALTDDSVSPHGARTAKSPSTPPTPLRYEQGEGVGDGVQQASPAAANGSRQTETQRAKPITDAYYALQPMCKWPAINGVVIHAIKSGKYTDDQIQDGLLRMAKSGQSVTVDSLRVEIEGFPPIRRGSPQRGAPLPAGVSPHEEHKFRP